MQNPQQPDRPDILPRLEDQLREARQEGFEIPPMPGIYFEAAFITPSRATAMLEQPTLNRLPNKANLERLTQDMRANQYYVTHQGIAYDKNGVLVDGGHRLRAIIESGTAQWIEVAYGIDPAAVPGIDAGKIRVLKDVLDAHGADKTQTRQAITNLAARVLDTWEENETITTARKRKNSTYTLVNWHALIEEVIDFPDVIAQANIMYRADDESPGIPLSVGGAFRFLATQFHYTDQANDFIRRVGTGDIGGTNTPERKLRGKIKTLKADQKSLDTVTALAYVIVAYNKFVAGQNVSRLVLPTSGEMPKIVGYQG